MDKFIFVIFIPVVVIASINASPAVDGGRVAGHGGRLQVGGGGDVGPAGRGDVVAVELVEQSPRLMERVQTAVI